MMKEARLIMPDADNNGVPLAALHEHLEGTICDTFGGVTVTLSHGAWRDPKSGKLYREPGRVYSIACDDTEENATLLRDLAAWAAREGRQECVYLAQPNGAVEFVAPAVPAVRKPALRIVAAE